MALAHMGLDHGSIPCRFTEKAAIAPHGSERVPVLLYDQKPVADSWAIAEAAFQPLGKPTVCDNSTC